MKYTTTRKPLYDSLIRVFLPGILATMLHTGYAQNIAINSTGNTADASSMLDVSATNKGMLIPRVALTATNVAAPVTSPATSLMVYNTATAGTAPNNVVPGYYYWNGTQWVQTITNLTMANIYNASGSLTSARTVNLNGNTFQFQDNTQTFGGQTRFSYGGGSRLVMSTTTGRSDLFIQSGGSNFFLYQDPNSMSQISASGTSTGLSMGTPPGNATPIQLNTNGTQRILITGAGNVGIGTSNPSSLLHVSGSGAGSVPLLTVTNTNVAGNPSLKIYPGYTSNGSTLTEGNQYAVVFDQDPGALSGGTQALFDFHGQLRAISTGTLSDIRLKENISDLNEYGLAEVLKIQPRRYTLKEYGTPDVGVIAQELKAIVPEIVYGNESTGLLSVDYSKITLVLVNAIKEQQQEIEALKLQIAGQTAQMASTDETVRMLSTRVEALQKRVDSSAKHPQKPGKTQRTAGLKLAKTE